MSRAKEGYVECIGLHIHEDRVTWARPPPSKSLS